MQHDSLIPLSLFFSDSTLRADIGTHATAHADDLINLCLFLLVIPDEAWTAENAGAKAIASALFPNAHGLIHLYLERKSAFSPLNQGAFALHD
jgi:hypothetical protein